jgi:hypothetical protein
MAIRCCGVIVGRVVNIVGRIVPDGGEAEFIAQVLIPHLIVVIAVREKMVANLTSP